MMMDDDSWQVVKTTCNHFVRPNREGKAPDEVVVTSNIAAKSCRTTLKQTNEQEPVIKVNMTAGDKIMVLSGPFKDFEASG